MKRWPKSISLAVAFASVLAAVLIGQAPITFSEIVSGIIGDAEPTQGFLILTSIRLPRVCVAILCGCALSAAGVLTQGLFRNPIASPSILGISSGAAAGVALLFFFTSTTVSWYYLPLAASTGAFLISALLLAIVYVTRQFSVEQLLLIGFALNSFLAAFASLIISLLLEDFSRLPAIMYWLLGGLNARTWSHSLMGIAPVLIGLVLAFYVTKLLDVLTLGEEVAQTLSVDTHRLKKLSLVAIALLVGASVSMAGAISFIGLIVPHITRILVGPQHRRLFICSCLNGISLLCLADILARTVRAPMELQVGVLIALIGAPSFALLLLRQLKGAR